MGCAASSAQPRVSSAAVRPTCRSTKSARSAWPWPTLPSRSYPSNVSTQGPQTILAGSPSRAMVAGPWMTSSRRRRSPQRALPSRPAWWRPDRRGRLRGSGLRPSRSSRTVKESLAMFAPRTRPKDVALAERGLVVSGGSAARRRAGAPGVVAAAGWGGLPAAAGLVDLRRTYQHHYDTHRPHRALGPSRSPTTSPQPTTTEPTASGGGTGSRAAPRICAFARQRVVVMGITRVAATVILQGRPHCWCLVIATSRHPPGGARPAARVEAHQPGRTSPQPREYPAC
jgi:hypothetical protein